MKIVKWCEKHLDEVGGPSFSHFISDLGLTGTWSKSYDSEKLSLALRSHQPSVPPLHKSNQVVLFVMWARGEVRAKIMCKMSPSSPPKKFPFCHHITAGSGCLQRCCRLALTQHSCGCSVKKASPVEEELSSKTASVIASYPLHKASLSFPTKGGEKKPGRFRKKFFTSPPPLTLPPSSLLLLLRPRSGPTPPPSSALFC